jgi:hypothetical protein
VHVGAYSPILSCQTFNAARGAGPSSPPGIESPGVAAGDLGLFWTELRGGSTVGEHVVKS